MNDVRLAGCLPLRSADFGMFDLMPALPQRRMSKLSAVMERLESRIHRDASVESSWGESGGVQLINLGAEPQTWDMVATDDGGMLISGQCKIDGQWNAFLVRLNADGNLDPSFDNDGVLIFDQMYVFSAIAVGDDGSIVAVGTTPGPEENPSHDFAAVRFDAHGKMDAQFGNAGITIVPDGPFRSDRISFDSDGKIVVAGDLDQMMGVLRLQSNGILDTSFANGGLAVLDFDENAGGNFEFVDALSIQEDGKILVGGTTQFRGLWQDDYSSFGQVVVARLQASGDLDESFGRDGIVSFPAYAYQAFEPQNSWTELTALLPLKDGSILVAGDNWDGLFALTRLHADGTTDSSFGNAGFVLDEEPQLPNPVTLQELNDGSIVLAGSSWGLYGAIYDRNGLKLASTIQTAILPDAAMMGGRAITVSATGNLFIAGDTVPDQLQYPFPPGTWQNALRVIAVKAPLYEMLGIKIPTPPEVEPLPSPEPAPEPVPPTNPIEELTFVPARGWPSGTLENGMAGNIFNKIVRFAGPFASGEHDFSNLFGDHDVELFV